MSQLGTPYSPPPPYAPPPVPPPSRPTSADIPSWIVLLAAAVAMALAGLLGFVVLNSGGDAAPAAAPRAGRTFPTHWNHRVAPLATYVAHERGLRFEHPVAVRFLTPKAYAKAVVNDDSWATPGMRRQATSTLALLQGLDLSGPEPSAVRALLAPDTVTPAYYSFGHQRIEVRGHDLTPAVRVELVHSLMGALLDQHFQLGHRLRTLSAPHGTTTGIDSVRATVLDAVSDGDASRVADRYRSHLPAAQRRTVAAADRADRRHTLTSLAHVPWLVTGMVASPSALGEIADRTVLASSHGTAVLNRLLRHTPADDSTLLDPLQALTAHAEPAAVPYAAVPHGDKRLASGQLGAVAWYLLLSDRLPDAQALTAADRWNGDSYVVYRHQGATCARLAVRVRTPADASAMYTALRAWTGVDAARYDVSQHGSQVSLGACSSGSAHHLAHGLQLQALQLVAARQSFAGKLLQQHAGVAVAGCASKRIMATLTFAQLRNDYVADNPWVTDRIRQIVAECAGSNPSSTTRTVT